MKNIIRVLKSLVRRRLDLRAAADNLLNTISEGIIPSVAAAEVEAGEVEAGEVEVAEAQAAAPGAAADMSWVYKSPFSPIENRKIGATGGRVGFKDGSGDIETGEKGNVEKIKKILSKKGIDIKSGKAESIANKLFKDFGKMGLKGGKLLRWLQFEYDVLFESLIYAYHRQYEGDEPDVAREALWLPKIIAKYAPDLWKKAGFKPFEIGVWEGTDTVYEKRLYEIRGTEKENFGKVVGVKKPVKNYIDNQKRMEELSSKWESLEFQKKGSSRAQPTPEQVKNFENQQAALAEEYQKLEQLNKPDSVTGYHSAYTTALEAQETERGVKRTEAHKKRLGVDEERLDELDELLFTERDKMKYPRTFGEEKREVGNLERAQKRFEDEQADKRRKAVEDKYPTLTKSEVD